MKYVKIILIGMGLLVVSPLQADLYLELAAGGGGDKLASTTTGDSINAGGGIQFAIGTQNRLGDGSALRFAAGYLFDTLDAIDGSAESSAITLDGMYLINNGPHTFGVGASMHMSPEYTQTGGGYADIDIQFDDAIGPAVEYQYTFSNNIGIGFRFTDLTYQSGNLKLDASSFGMFLSTGF